MKAVATDLKAIYSAASETEAEFNLELKALEMGWASSQHQQTGACARSRAIIAFFRLSRPFTKECTWPYALSPSRVDHADS
jgi:hypothetical protein